ncbi:unnamed protein product [Lota lota]
MTSEPVGPNDSHSGTQMAGGTRRQRRAGRDTAGPDRLPLLWVPAVCGWDLIKRRLTKRNCSSHSNWCWLSVKELCPQTAKLPHGDKPVGIFSSGRSDWTIIIRKRAGDHQEATQPPSGH